MPVRISRFITGHVTPDMVEGANFRPKAGMQPYMWSFAQQYKPVMTWNTTRSCNLRCVHCYSDSETKSYQGELNHEESLKMIDDLAEYGVPILLFSGGEPLMRRRVFELMTYAKKVGVRPTLSTNGTLISRDVAAKMKQLGLGYAGISMDGYEKTNDEFRGKAGAFGDMIRGVENCLAEGVKVSLRFTVTSHNAQDLPKVFDFLERKNLPRMCVYHLVYSGRGSDMMKDDVAHKWSREIVDSIIDRAEYFHAKGLEKDILTIDNHCDGPYLILRLRARGQQKLADDIYKLLLRQGGNRSGIGFGDIDNLGNVHPDQFSWDESWGNVRQKPFRKIWDNIAAPEIAGYKFRRPLIKGRCGKCQFFEICNANFRARARYATGEMWESDPACYLTDSEIGVTKDAQGEYHSVHPKLENEINTLKQKAAEYAQQGYNVPLALAAEANLGEAKALSAIPKEIGALYLAKAKELGPQQAAQAACDEHTKRDQGKLDEIDANRGTNLKESEAAAMPEPVVEPPVPVAGGPARGH
ncbi:MAG: radical SAM protein [Planctomycetes bacterium]|nr:radical SAM protein [Planctomycetota bacterium]